MHVLNQLDIIFTSSSWARCSFISFLLLQFSQNSGFDEEGKKNYVYSLFYTEQVERKKKKKEKEEMEELPPFNKCKIFSQLQLLHFCQSPRRARSAVLMHMNLEEFSYELVAPSHIPFVVVMFLTSYVCYICCNVFGYMQRFQGRSGRRRAMLGCWRMAPSRAATERPPSFVLGKGIAQMG